MKFVIFTFYLILALQSFGQNYYLQLEGKKALSNVKVTVVKFTDEVIEVKLYFQSSERCACEPTFNVKLTKRADGTYSGLVYRNPDKRIKAIVKSGKISSIVIENDAVENCCDIFEGVYFPKQ